ncbi:PaaI family thioesterase [Phenylobacterium sp. LjRoot219]|uniref:PaaI family thioesterase n=1 Tax=Phenylobacterium sp. LjRoot219 TaxID=3342283 RepID=UPI003ECEA87B
MRDETSLAVVDPDHAWPAPDRTFPDVGGPYVEMIDTLREFLDTVAGARPDAATIAALKDDLAAWTKRLGPQVVPEREQLFARLHEAPGRGQTMSPALHVEVCDPGDFRGHVTFGRYFLGVNGAVHGGTLPLMFDEVLGRTAAHSGLRLRTAYLKTNFRALTPLDTRLEVRGWLERQEGRKYFVRGELRHGDVVCADAEGLFVALRPEQQ